MKLVTIGCSFTEGQGLSPHQIQCYTYQLAEKTNLEFYNFGLCGASNDYIFRKIFELINSNEITKEDIIIIQWTHYFRRELPIIYNDRKWYHYVPNSYNASQDKIIYYKERYNPNNLNFFVQNEHINQDTDGDFIEIEKVNEKRLNTYILNFLNEDYQKNTTINYINSLYTYLEHFGYKHLHFFGWPGCVISDVYQDKPLFLKENFGEFTNTIGNEHPDKEGHLIWAEYLYKKIKELNYINKNLL